MLTEATLSETIDPTIFRSYDIRGIVQHNLTEHSVELIGKAIGSLIREQGENQVVIARDGRLSGPLLSHALCRGLLAVGCNVTDIGSVPTPLLYYAAQVFAGRSGVMLTGSHNPPNYNGLKMVVKGVTLAEGEIQALYQRICEQRFQVGEGVLEEIDIVARYVDEVINNVQLARPLTIVIDAGNGITGMMAPALFRRLGCEVHELFCEVDGHFPNHHPDPSDTHNLRDLIQCVQEKKADIGLAFDGDGDRLGVITCRGEIIWPDRLLMLFAKAVIAATPNAKIIFDVKCTAQLPQLIIALQGEPLMWKTGHSLIKAKLAETKAKLAGEMSGHFFFNDRWYGFDDALYAGARLLELLAATTDDSHTVFAAIPNSINTPELKVAVSDTEKFLLMQALITNANFPDAKEIITIDGLRVNFADGFGLVRPSNTTPYLILRFEASTKAMLEKIQNDFRAWLLSVRADLVLPF